MNLRQLHFITQVARQGLNVSAAAETLFISQPGVSKQIRQLEDELGVRIFERRGRQLTRITPAGRVILEYAARALVEVDAIKEAAQEYSDPSQGTLSIATTHTQARYRLPPVIEAFRARYPRIALHLHQGSPDQIAELTARGTVDFAIATESPEHFEELLMMPCYHWERVLVVPPEHPLRDRVPLTLEALAEYPIVTYVFGFSPRSPLEQAFRRRRLTPRLSLTATDTDVIKTYVRQGLGVGIIARMAFEPAIDEGLVALDASQLFARSTTYIGFRRGTFLREFMYDFIEGFAPHLSRGTVEMVLQTRSRSGLQSLFMDLPLPTL